MALCRWPDYAERHFLGHIRSQTAIYLFSPIIARIFGIILISSPHPGTIFLNTKEERKQMDTNLYYTRGWVLRRYIRGPLASHINPFSEFLAKQGYAYATGQRYVREVGHLSRWLDQKQIGLEHLNHEVINDYCRSRGSGMRSRLKNGPYLQLLKYLRQNNIIKTPDPASTPIDECGYAQNPSEKYSEIGSRSN